MRPKDTWWEDAECRDSDPRDFEAMVTGSGRRAFSRKDQWATARAICARCPVMEDCFWDALERPNTLVGHHEEMFVAGLTPQEMRAKRKKWNAIKGKTA